MNENRRRVLRSGLILTAAAPLLAMDKAAELARPPRRPLPPVETGTILTAKVMNDLITTVNELANRI